MSMFITKLRNLAAALEHSVSDEIKAYTPKLKAAADDVEHAFQSWDAAVEHWIETHFEPAAEAAKEEARKVYEAIVKTARALHDEAAAKTN